MGRMREVNLGIRLDRDYRDMTSPYQWAREAVKNSIEAAARNVYAGVAWPVVESMGVYWRTFEDDGVGMDDEELGNYINVLGGSGKIVGSPVDNYGIGLKTSTLPWNKGGVMILSVKDGEASMCWLKEIASGEYGLHDFDTEDGLMEVVPVQEMMGIDWPGMIPDWIGEQDPDDEFAWSGHGTVVVLMGNQPIRSDEEFAPGDPAIHDTLLGDPERDGGGYVSDLATYLNTRLWEVPEGTSVRVLNFDSATRASWPKCKDQQRGKGDHASRRKWDDRRVVGAKAYITKPFITKEAKEPESGIVRLTSVAGKPGVTLHWWLLGESHIKPGTTKERSYMGPGPGFIGTLWQDELYDVRDGASAHWTYKRFGIDPKNVRERTYIVIEPDAWGASNPDGAFSDGERKQIICKRGELPQDLWAAEFANDLPEAISAALNAEYAQDVETIERPDSRKKIIEKFGARYKISRLIADMTGKLQGGKQVQGGKQQKLKVPRKPNPNRKQQPGGRGGRIGPVVNLVEGAGGEPGRRAKDGRDLPTPVWLDTEERVANWFDAGGTPPRLRWFVKFDENANLLHINAFHPAALEAMQYWMGEYDWVTAQDREKVITGVVRSVFDEDLIDRVAQTQAIEKDYPTEYQRLLYSEAVLSSAAMGLVGKESRIRTTLDGVFRSAPGRKTPRRAKKVAA